MTDMAFQEFITRYKQQYPNLPDTSHLHVLAIDPGQTSGYAHFIGNDLVDCGQSRTADVEQSTKVFRDMIEHPDYPRIDFVIVEDYRIYKWKTDTHTNSDIPTARIIGCLETFAAVHGLNIIKQPAQVAKTFCTDKRLHQWGFWQEGKVHARDAIRHGCYFLLFGKIIQR